MNRGEAVPEASEIEAVPDLTHDQLKEKQTEKIILIFFQKSQLEYI